MHEERRNRHDELHKNIEEEHKMQEEFHKRQHELHKRIMKLHKDNAEFHRYHKHIRYTGPVIIIFNLLVWYLLFRFVGIKVFSVFVALLIGMGGFFQFFLLRRIENRILKPIVKLKKGVEQIAEGNYNVKIDSDVNNEIGVLIESFNEMAHKLHESEIIKAEYEENRRMLIANISHDLKTPITSIQGYAEAIMDGNPSSKKNIDKYLKIIYNNAAYINKLVDDLFLFSKLDIQKLDFYFTEVRIKPFFNDLMEEFKLEFDEKQIEFGYVDKMEGDCRVNIDAKRMHQVLRNIIGNAIKYGPERNLSIRSELYMKDGFACIDINDNGPGIPKDKLPHVFDRFYRIDTERTKDFMSTGLGLAIAKELVEAHGGKIMVSSVEDEGTCFTIMLPAVDLATEPPSSTGGS